MCQTCFFHLRRIRSVRRQLGRDVTAKLVTTFVLSRLDHCNAVLAGLPAMTLTPLQRVLHAAARTVLDLKLHDHVTLALRELHWLPITERIQYKLCLLVHKMFVGHAPDYIASLLMPASDIPSRSSLHSSSNCDLVVPRMSPKIGDRAFSVATVAILIYFNTPSSRKKQFIGYSGALPPSLSKSVAIESGY